MLPFLLKPPQFSSGLQQGFVQSKPASYMCAAAAAKSIQSCPTLCDPIDSSPPGSPRPWDSPGKNTGVGCHFLLQCMKMKSESEFTPSMGWGAIAFSLEMATSFQSCTNIN